MCQSELFVFHIVPHVDVTSCKYSIQLRFAGYWNINLQFPFVFEAVLIVDLEWQLVVHLFYSCTIKFPS